MILIFLLIQPAKQGYPTSYPNSIYKVVLRKVIIKLRSLKFRTKSNKNSFMEIDIFHADLEVITMRCNFSMMTQILPLYRTVHLLH